MPEHSPNLARLSYRPLTTVWLLAIALFVLGPPMGSIDVDNDGNPDASVVVSAPRVSDVSRTSGQNDELQNTQTSVVTSLGPSKQEDDFQVVTHDGRTVLHSCCVIRC